MRLGLLLGLLAQTTPANITKVPRDAATEYCSLKDTSGDLAAGVAHEALVLVNPGRRDYTLGSTGGCLQGTCPVTPAVPHRYQMIRMWIAPSTGAHLRVDTVVNDTVPTCPSSTPHAGFRPHVVSLPALTAGTYRLLAQMLDTQSAVIAEATLLMPVVVR